MGIARARCEVCGNKPCTCHDEGPPVRVLNPPVQVTYTPRVEQLLVEQNELLRKILTYLEGKL